MAVLDCKVGRIENRMKRPFPAAAAQARERKDRAPRRSNEASITAEHALAEFDRVVGLAASGANEEGERKVGGKLSRATLGAGSG